MAGASWVSRPPAWRLCGRGALSRPRGAGTAFKARPAGSGAPAVRPAEPAAGPAVRRRQRRGPGTAGGGRPGKQAPPSCPVAWLPGGLRAAGKQAKVAQLGWGRGLSQRRAGTCHSGAAGDLLPRWRSRGVRHSAARRPPGGHSNVLSAFADTRGGTVPASWEPATVCTRISRPVRMGCPAAGCPRCLPATGLQAWRGAGGLPWGL